ncbi:hypothetical protein TrVFT333_007392 [Trichoderma virens FT-333]|nr:hypothetical protein TrVFT333_007392 [Trichoderma virens FT-333]
MRVQTMQTGRETHDDVEFNPEQTNSRLSQGMDLETTDAVVYRMDRLVQDLLASRKDLENEKRKTTDKDVEIAQLKQEVAHLLDRAHEEGQKREAAEAEMRELGRMSVVSSVNCEEVDELRRLLVFHKTNGEQLSRKLRDLQATYKDLEAQLQVTEMALQEQMSLVSGLGICTHGDNSSDS